MLSISIITCTHNPHRVIFEKLINAVAKLIIPVTINVEWLVVDNNSETAIQDQFDFSSISFNVQHILEKEPGLTAARVAGIEKAKSDWVIFFDDDNEPCQDYLFAIKKQVEEYPAVGAWGPGVVKVELLGRKLSNWYHNNKRLYQERTETNIRVNHMNAWQDCYPYGTGMVIKTEIAKKYAELVFNGNLTLSDRLGKSLSSGGDTQMVFLAIQQGFSAGVSPALQLNHLIEERKVCLGYLLRQIYSTASCSVKAFNEVQPHHLRLRVETPASSEILKRVYTTFRIHLFRKKTKDFLLLLYQRLGEINARYVALGQTKKPLILNFFERIINV